jgi:hypothetical protein
VTWSRVAFMVALLTLGLVLTRVLGRTTPKVSKAEAVAVARPNVDFKPQGYNIRLVRQGIPPRPVWAVSFWIRKAGGGFSRITLVLVDANSGQVMQVRRTTRVAPVFALHTRQRGKLCGPYVVHPAPRSYARLCS